MITVYEHWTPLVSARHTRIRHGKLKSLTICHTHTHTCKHTPVDIEISSTSILNGERAACIYYALHVDIHFSFHFFLSSSPHTKQNSIESNNKIRNETIVRPSQCVVCVRIHLFWPKEVCLLNSKVIYVGILCCVHPSDDYRRSNYSQLPCVCVCCWLLWCTTKQYINWAMGFVFFFIFFLSSGQWLLVLQTTFIWLKTTKKKFIAFIASSLDRTSFCATIAHLLSNGFKRCQADSMGREQTKNKFLIIYFVAAAVVVVVDKMRSMQRAHTVDTLANRQWIFFAN